MGHALPSARTGAACHHTHASNTPAFQSHRKQARDTRLILNHALGVKALSDVSDVGSQRDGGQRDPGAAGAQQVCNVYAPDTPGGAQGLEDGHGEAVRRSSKSPQHHQAAGQATVPVEARHGRQMVGGKFAV